MTSRQDRPRVTLFRKDTSQAQVVLGVRTCSRHDERRYALRLLNTLLGENMSSRLFQQLREARGLVYHVQSSVSAFHDAGTLDISLGLDAENLPKALRLILRELDRLRTTAPGAGELRQARDYLLGQMALSLENTESQMNWLGEQWLGFGKIIPPTEVQRRLAAVTGRRDPGCRPGFLPAGPAQPGGGQPAEIRAEPGAAVPELRPLKEAFHEPSPRSGSRQRVAISRQGPVTGALPSAATPRFRA